MLNFCDFIQVFVFTTNHHLNETVPLYEDSLMHYKGRPSNYLFQVFLKLKGQPVENSSCFSNVQPCTITCTLDAFIT